MATNPVSQPHGDSFLLELLHFAGWRVQVRTGSPTRIRATRGAVRLDVTGATLPAAAGTVFARAMRSGQAGDRTDGE
jgi:hypothetical protein